MTDIKCPAERIVSVNINGELVVRLHCSPVNLKELGAGFLYNEAIIKKAEDIADITATDGKIDISLRNKIDDFKDITGSRTSGCGSASVLLIKNNLKRLQTKADNLEQEDIQGYVSKLLKMAELYKETGGIHCSGLVVDSEIVAVFEDIGRHNTFDKIAGHILMNKIDPQEAIVVTTGRVSYEMAQKLISAGIPAVISMTAATDLAVELAKEFGLTIIGYARGASYKIYNATGS